MAGELAHILRTFEAVVLPMFFSLSYPHDFRMLPRVCQEVLEPAARPVPV